MKTLIALVLVVAVCTPVASARTWTDSTGTHTVEAEFVDFKDGKVQLKKEDGKTITIPIENLSKEDQEFVKSQGQPRARIGTNAVVGPLSTEEPVEVRQFKGHKDGIKCLAFSPDGRRAVSGAAIDDYSAKCQHPSPPWVTKE